MDKKQLKRIEIIEVKINRLSCGQDVTGEYSTSCNVDFLLGEPFKFNVFEQEFEIDRVKMFDWYGDEIGLRYANNKRDFCCFPVSKVFVHKIYNRIVQEQGEGGLLKGWDFREEIMDILKDESAVRSCW